MVAESVFGPSENTKLLDPRNNPTPNYNVEEMRIPRRIVDTLLNNENPYIVYRCILAAQKLREDPDFDLKVFCRPLLSDPDVLPIRKLFLTFLLD